MANRRVLVDSSVFIEHLRARDKTKTHLYELENKAEVETCSIVAAEIFYGARRIEAEERAWALLRPFPIHAFTLEMASRGSAIVRELMKTNRIQELRDIMIAATALDLGLPVATLNRSHFEKIPELKLKTLRRRQA